MFFKCYTSFCLKKLKCLGKNAPIQCSHVCMKRKNTIFVLNLRAFYKGTLSWILIQKMSSNNWLIVHSYILLNVIEFKFTLLVRRREHFYKSIIHTYESEFFSPFALSVATETRLRYCFHIINKSVEWLNRNLSFTTIKLRKNYIRL